MNYTAPQFDACALLTIDVQNDFSLPGAAAEIRGTCEVLPKLQMLAQAFRKASRPIVHVVRLYLEDGSNADLCRREVIEKGKRVVAPGSQGAELVDALKPSVDVRHDPKILLQGGFQKIGNREWLMYKPRWGAFYQTKLEEHLKSLGVNTLVIAGCNFPNCPRSAIYQASERDFKIVAASDAISGLYDKGLEELKNIAVELRKTEELIACVCL